LRKPTELIPHVLFALFLLIQLLPDEIKNETIPMLRDSATVYAVAFAAALEFFAVLVSLLFLRRRTFVDIVTVVLALLVLWTLLTAKLNILKPYYFPPPGRVLRQFLVEHSVLLVHVVSSLGLIIDGFALGLAAAIPLGLIIGYSARTGTTAMLISKFLASIPPIVYIPYGIALLPTFRSVSVMVIFLATFWPVLAGTIAGVVYTERRYIDAARVLGCGKARLLFNVILPGALPQIFTGCNQGLSVSFILLASAEMIGARSGMGQYVKISSDNGDFTRTLTGVILIGVVVSVASLAFSKFQKFMLRWKV
jgi:NitT/TauT family transport system permease protein